MGGHQRTPQRRRAGRIGIHLAIAILDSHAQAVGPVSYPLGYGGQRRGDALRASQNPPDFAERLGLLGIGKLDFAGKSTIEERRQLRVQIELLGRGFLRRQVPRAVDVQRIHRDEFAVDSAFGGSRHDPQEAEPDVGLGLFGLARNPEQAFRLLLPRFHRTRHHRRHRAIRLDPPARREDAELPSHTVLPRRTPIRVEQVALVEHRVGNRLSPRELRAGLNGPGSAVLRCEAHRFLPPAWLLPCRSRIVHFPLINGCPTAVLILIRLSPACPQAR
ncbi:hypothetical protein ACH347_27160 [Saccharopolyspora sp. 5N102]|uniref:hypothetical protein n=1 Tax=Saccharopolyspora sp. 5N102 TaxID=3375155 RepID=UPI0037B0A4DE